VLRSCYTGPAFQHSHGLSVYFPWSKSEDLDTYNRNLENGAHPKLGLTFANETGWGVFLKQYVDETIRPVRPQRGEDLREGHFNSNPTNEIVETLLLVRTSPTGSPKGLGALGSMKNPPTKWRPSECSRGHLK